MRRVISGALAGLVATMAMTMAMRRLYAQLERRDRYPLPPREIVDRLAGTDGEQYLRSETLLAHFGFGASAGAVFALLPPRERSGLLYGVGVWSLSYLGWIPTARILEPAWRHPAQRNLLMIAVHLVWGAALAGSLRELEAAQATIFADATNSDAALQETREKGQRRWR